MFELSTSLIISRLKVRKLKNKYDKLDIKFHDKVNKGYKLISKNNRFIKIDASKSKNQIHDNIIKNIISLIWMI